MDSFRARVESWIKDQKQKYHPIFAWSPPPPPKWRWPPWRSHDSKEEDRRVKEELEMRRKQLRDLCRAVKADNVSELQDVLCSMVLSECVYKRPTAEMIRMINKFKADFGGQVSLDRVQPSLDHVPHRYLLAEAGDTIYASFIGTKQYKDVMADANILQGILFHDDEDENIDANEVTTGDNVENIQNKIDEKLRRPVQVTPVSRKKKSKPAAHRGFLARAKGIPALELYKLAQKKNRKLVLCGHSLGGAVAALATLAILRVIASSPLIERDKVPVKCITFSQPPVGNAALRDYVHKKGWHHFFKTYCIPEDLVPRILSPAYFHHYNAQPVQVSIGTKVSDSSLDEQQHKTSASKTSKNNNRERLVLGLGPVQTSFWRLSKLVPLESVQKHLNRFKQKQECEESSSSANSDLVQKGDEMDSVPQALEIQENSDGISLSPVHMESNESLSEAKSNQTDGKSFSRSVDPRRWQGVPYLPSYVPFGELYLLGNLSVDFLSDAEYSKLTSVKTLISELRERFQSHSMKSYRARFQKIFDTFMPVHASPFSGLEQSPQFPHLQQWLGLVTADAVELGNIVEAPVIHAATSILPLNWSDHTSAKNAEPFKVDVLGYGLHFCTLIQAQVNGHWCSTSVEYLPSAPPYSLNHDVQPELQKMRVLVGAPLRRPPKHGIVADTLMPMFPSGEEGTKASQAFGVYSPDDEQLTCNEGLNGFMIFCTNDFTTVSKEVYVRTRKVRLLGLEGAGRTSLFSAILGQRKDTNGFNLEIMPLHTDAQEGVSGGLCYLDPAGINLQELHLETNRFREQLQLGIHDIRRKTDMIVLVHNLSHKIPWFQQTDTSQPQPALSPLLNEATVLGIPWVLAITNKYSVSSDQQRMLVNSVMDSYQAPPSMTRVINSCPYVIPSIETSPEPQDFTDNGDVNRRLAVQSLILSPINFVRMPFQKKTSIMPVDGVNSFRKLVHGILRSHEEAALEELARERLSQEMARKNLAAMDRGTDTAADGGSAVAAAIGASIGAGVGIVLALVMGAASALRKP